MEDTARRHSQKRMRGETDHFLTVRTLGGRYFAMRQTDWCRDSAARTNLSTMGCLCVVLSPELFLIFVQNTNYLISEV